MKPEGFLALVLHTHLPFVRHPEQEHFLEERWLFEAITETYLPLLERFERLANNQVPVRLTMSFTPTLLAMLEDTLLQSRYLRHLEQLIELCEKEVQRTRWMPPFNRLALFYHHRLTSARAAYADHYRRDLIHPFRELSERGFLEPIASCATYAFLPLMALYPSAVRAQIRVGVGAFQRAFGKSPAGFWLPECGYASGHDEFLRELGVRYVLLDAHGILFGSPRPKYGVYAPAICPSGVAAFGRDLESSRSVWSAQEGYPGDPEYREFYRDIGHDLDYDYVRPYLNGDGARVNTGIKYYRITGQTQDKQPYDPDRALERAATHAANFIFDREQQVKRLRSLIDRAPVIVSPYDAELFGHWWFEGPDWLECLLRKANTERHAVQFIGLSDYFQHYPTNQVLEPSPSSWGYGGYHEVWLNGANDWIYRHLHKLSERMTEVSTQQVQPDPLLRRALNQMARETFLAQASDWAFILKTQTHTAYAYRRLQQHITRFNTLYDMVQQARIEEPVLSDLEHRDPLFPFLEYRVFAP